MLRAKCPNLRAASERSPYDGHPTTTTTTATADHEYSLLFPTHTTTWSQLHPYLSHLCVQMHGTGHSNAHPARRSHVFTLSHTLHWNGMALCVSPTITRGTRSRSELHFTEIRAKRQEHPFYMAGSWVCSSLSVGGPCGAFHHRVVTV